MAVTVKLLAPALPTLRPPSMPTAASNSTPEVNATGELRLIVPVAPASIVKFVVAAA